MLTKVEVRSVSGQLLTLMLDDVSDGLVLEDIQGLDPVKATLVSSPTAGVAGAQFQSSHRESRNILMKLGLEPDYATSSVEELRDSLYDFFMPDSEIFMRFFRGALTVDISGHVEDFSAPLFAKEPEANLSIMCFEPDFVALTPTTYSGNTVNDTAEFTIEYPGSVKTGFVLTINVNRTETDFTIYHRGPDDIVRSMHIAVDMVAGDVLKVSTVEGDKFVTLTHASVTSEVLYALTPQSPWLELVKGTNHLRVYTTGIQIPFTLKYTPRYGGL